MTALRVQSLKIIAGEARINVTVQLFIVEPLWQFTLVLLALRRAKPAYEQYVTMICKQILA